MGRRCHQQVFYYQEATTRQRCQPCAQVQTPSCAAPKLVVPAKTDAFSSVGIIAKAAPEDFHLPAGSYKDVDFYQTNINGEKHLVFRDSRNTSASPLRIVAEKDVAAIINKRGSLFNEKAGDSAWWKAAPDALKEKIAKGQIEEAPGARIEKKPESQRVAELKNDPVSTKIDKAEPMFEAMKLNPSAVPFSAEKQQAERPKIPNLEWKINHQFINTPEMKDEDLPFSAQRISTPTPLLEASALKDPAKELERLLEIRQKWREAVK